VEMTAPPMPEQAWVFNAHLRKVVDGDTLDAMLDAGLHGYRVARLRILGVNAPEVHGASRPAGLAATAYVVAWLATVPADDEWPLRIQTAKSDVFGRYLATIWRRYDGACIGTALLASHHAVPFDPSAPAPPSP
jgi:micrococcal nuclease